MNTTAERITELRKQCKLSQDDLAERAHVSRQTVYRWESGAQLPKAEKIKLLCEIFGTDTEYILHGTVKEEAALTDVAECGERKKSFVALKLITAIAVSVTAVFAVIFAVALGFIFFQPASGIEDVTISQFHNPQGIIIFVVGITLLVTASVTLIYLLIRKKSKKNGKCNKSVT